jgi:hypothetical protein
LRERVDDEPDDEDAGEDLEDGREDGGAHKACCVLKCQCMLEICVLEVL